MANRPAPALVLREGDRDELTRLTRSSSVRAGLAAVDSRADAAMFIPVDQPGLTPKVLDQLINGEGGIQVGGLLQELANPCSDDRVIVS